MKKILIKVLMVQMLVLSAFLLAFTLNAKEVELTDEGANCLGNCIPETGNENIVGYCYRDMTGKDQFNGNIIDCSGDEGYCQRTFCWDKPYCYYSQINIDCEDD